MFLSFETIRSTNSLTRMREHSSHEFRLITLENLWLNSKLVADRCFHFTSFAFVLHSITWSRDGVDKRGGGVQEWCILFLAFLACILRRCPQAFWMHNNYLPKTKLKLYMMKTWLVHLAMSCDYSPPLGDSAFDILHALSSYAGYHTLYL